MPVFKDPRKLYEIKGTVLHPDFEAKMADCLTGDDMITVEAYTGSKFIIGMLSVLIREWNFTNEEGNPLPITFDNLCKFDIHELTEIFEKYNAVVGSKKK